MYACIKSYFPLKSKPGPVFTTFNVESSVKGELKNFNGNASVAKMTAIPIDVESIKKSKRVPQSQTAALPRHQEEGETEKKNKQAQIDKRTKSTKISSLFPKRGNRNAKRTEKHKNQITQGKT